MLSAALANLLLFLAAFGLGSWPSRYLPASSTVADRLSVALLGGLGMLGTLLFCVGQVRFSFETITVILSSSAMIGVYFVAKYLYRRDLRLLEFFPPILPATVIVLVLLVTLVGGFAAPSGDVKMDAIAYHLLGPRVWLHDGVIRPLPDESLTAFPAIVESLFGALMAIGGQRAPELFSVVALISILLVSFSLSLRVGLAPSRAWWVVALVGSMPAVYRGAYGAFNDAIYSSFVLCAARIGFDAEEPSHFVIFGAFCGFAAGTKYTGLAAGFLLFSLVALTILTVRTQHKQLLFRYLGISAVVALLIALPSYLRNWLVLGSPIYPPPLPLLRVFSSRYLPLTAIQSLSARMWKEGAGMGRGFFSLLLLPFHLTFHPANFINGAGGIGLAPLAFAPLGLWEGCRDWFGRVLVGFGLVQVLIWFATMQESRYLIHVYIITAIFAVLGWQYIMRISPSSGTLLCRVIVAVSVLYGSYMILSARVDDIHTAFSARFAETRRQSEIPFLQAMQYLNNDQAVTKVLVLNPRVPTYYLEKSYIKPEGRLGECTLPEPLRLSTLAAQVTYLSVTHVLDVAQENEEFLLPQDIKGFQMVFEVTGQRVYRVQPVAAKREED